MNFWMPKQKKKPKTGNNRKISLFPRGKISLAFKLFESIIVRLNVYFDLTDRKVIHKQI